MEGYQNGHDKSYQETKIKYPPRVTTKAERDERFLEAKGLLRSDSSLSRTEVCKRVGITISDFDYRSSKNFKGKTTKSQSRMQTIEAVKPTSLAIFGEPNFNIPLSKLSAFLEFLK